MDTIGKKITANIVYFTIRLCKCIFMMQDGVCRFQPTCTEYAVEAIKKLPIHIAVFFIIKRVLRCHPFNKGGYDPVPEKTTQSHVIMGECRKVF